MSRQPADDSAPRIHRHTLIEMNRSVFTARRDVAHQLAADALRNHDQMSLRDSRRANCRHALRLIQDALHATRRSQIRIDTPVIHYLRLLRDTVKAMTTLTEHEIVLKEEAAALSEVVGREQAAELQTASDAFSRGEKSILESIEELLRFGAPILASDSEQRVAAFTDDDRRRYELAAAQYRSSYAAARTDEERMASR